jgi:hypothetical protein
MLAGDNSVLCSVSSNTSTTLFPDMQHVYNALYTTHVQEQCLRGWVIVQCNVNNSKDALINCPSLLNIGASTMKSVTRPAYQLE